MAKGGKSGSPFGGSGGAGKHTGNTRKGGHVVPLKGAKGAGKGVPGDNPFGGK